MLLPPSQAVRRALYGWLLRSPGSTKIVERERLHLEERSTQSEKSAYKA